MSGRTTRVEPSPCLNCGIKLDCISDMLGEAVPSPGDYTICLRCGHLMVLDANLHVREPTGEELVAIAGDPNLIKLQRARGMAINPRGNTGAVIGKPDSRDDRVHRQSGKVLGRNRPPIKNA